MAYVERYRTIEVQGQGEGEPAHVVVTVYVTNGVAQTTVMQQADLPLLTGDVSTDLGAINAALVDIATDLASDIAALP